MILIKSKLLLLLYSLILLAFIILMVYVTATYSPSIIALISNPEKLKETLSSYGSKSVLVFIVLQILQIIIAVIPGELTQVSGGYVFGALLGTIYSMIGAFLGMLIVFFASRVLGFRILKMVMPEKTLAKFKFLINSEKSAIALFVLFLIPGIPKDAISYIAGLTPIKPSKFLIITMIARFPGILGSSVIGSNLQQENYSIVIIISIISLILFILGILSRDKIITFLHRNTAKQ